MENIIGLDVSKNKIDVCVYTTAIKPQYFEISNDESGYKKLLKELKKREVKLVVCEPTGGYEMEICKKLHNKYSIHRVNTYSFKSFSRSVSLSKTDKEDAYKLALYADRMDLKPNYEYEIDAETLRKLQQRREDLVLIISNEKKRFHHAAEGVDKKSIERVIEFLEKEISIIDGDLKSKIDASPERRERVNRLKSIPGIGECLAIKLVNCLPELGNKNYSNNQLAAIVGVAPYARDSGNKIGKRFIRGGRKIPRDALYIGKRQIYPTLRKINYPTKI